MLRSHWLLPTGRVRISAQARIRGLYQLLEGDSAFTVQVRVLMDQGGDLRQRAGTPERMRFRLQEAVRRHPEPAHEGCQTIYIGPAAL